MSEEYSVSKKPFGPVLTGDENYDEFTQNAEDYLRSQGLWEVAIGETTGEDTSSSLWKTKNSKAIGIYRGNVADRLKPKLRGLATCQLMIEAMAKEFEGRSGEQAHILLAALNSSRFLEGDSFEDFILEFEKKANRLAAMGHEVSEPQLLLALKVALPSSYISTLRGFNTRDKADQKYSTLRSFVMDDYRTAETIGVTQRSFVAAGSPRLPPPPPQRAFLTATANALLFTNSDGKLCTNDGKIVDCRICGANHTARDCTTALPTLAAPVDLQSLSRHSNGAAAPAPGAPTGAVGPNHARNVAKRQVRKAKLAQAHAVLNGAAVANPFAFQCIARTATAHRAHHSVDANSDEIIDTGADAHMRDSLEGLVNVREHQTIVEGVKEGAVVVAKHIGDLPYTTADGVSLHLSNVIAAPGISANIISLQKVADSGAVITLTKTGGEISLPDGRKIKVGRPQGTFWTLKNTFKAPEPAKIPSSTLLDSGAHASLRSLA
ncbi:hypothetical protein RQP46_004121 [Phenoliferia psychrophenolica]